MPKRVLLLDADAIAYVLAAAIEKPVEWEEGYFTWSVNYEEVCSGVVAKVDSLITEFDADEARLCVSDPEFNFRHDILPSYKSNRSGTKRPLTLAKVKEWIINERDGVVQPGLEADDVMGILSTYGGRHEKIIVSEDKDMRTIPGLLIQRGHIERISEAEADYNHLYQTLVGDAVDGYSGCPRIGAVKAAKLLDREASVEANWEAVVGAFEKAGMTEEDALIQARVARILRAEDYDFKKKEPKLWTP
jgi:DNA polymerase-1